MTETIGQRLKAAREEQKLTLEKVFEATRIRVPYLQALEADDLSGVPSPVQARGYLRNYAQYLGLDFEALLGELRALSTQPPSGEVIAPVDDSLPVEADSPVQDGGEGSTPPVTETIEPVSLDDTREESILVEEATPLPKTKPGRRKKTDSQPEPAFAESPTKRGGRKKVQPEPSPEPVPSESANVVQEEPAIAEVPVASPEPIPESEHGVEEVPSLPSDESSKIFQEIGAQLRERRELLSLHVDEVERNTHVKAHYLEALERGAMDELPSTVQTRGMLSNYATFLDMDVDAILLRFADALQARHRERNPQKPRRKPGQPIIANIPPIRTFIVGDIIFGVGMAVLLMGFAIWGVSRVVEIENQQEVQSTAPSISDVLLASPDPSQSKATATLQPVESIPGPATVTLVIPTQDVNVDVQVNLVAVERTYMRVVVDGDVAFEGRVVPGNAYPFQAESQIEVLVGNGAAIRTVYNGRDLGLMGTFGQVVNNVYTANEILTPTALPSPTATSTVPSTPTETPTATLSSTNTAVPSDTPGP